MCVLNLIIESSVFRYYMADIFDTTHFIEVSEEYFNNTVVKYRDQYNLVYVSGSEVLFINKTNPVDIVKRVRTNEVRVW